MTNVEAKRIRIIVDSQRQITRYRLQTAYCHLSKMAAIVDQFSDI